MKNIKRRVSAMVLTAVFATMQIASAATVPFDTGLGAGNGGAVINSATGGYVGAETGTNSATLNFNGNSHVNWNTLNVNAGETLNFNTVDGATGVTVLNTVNQGMSHIYGQVNADSGIGKLIISNPNGVLFDGAKFTTAGDTTITTQGAVLDPVTGAITYDTTAPTGYALDGSNYVMTINNSDFAVGGELNFVAPTMNVVNSVFNKNNVGGDIKFTTTNGQDYYVTATNASGTSVNVSYDDPDYDAVVTINGNCTGCSTKKNEVQALRIENIDANGNVYATSNKGIIKFVNGGEINGNLNVATDGSVSLNYVNNGHKLHVTGDTTASANGAMMYARVADFDGNLTMENGGGFLEVNDINVGKDMKLTTTAKSENPYGYKHFTHVNGNTNVGGNATINSENNIHIGNYNYEDKQLLDGNFHVGGDLVAHANNGHVMTTINVQADTIDMASEHLNVLTSDNAVLTANKFKFKSNGYIGALQDYVKQNGDPYTVDEQVIDLMETYTFIPKDIKSHSYMKLAGYGDKAIEITGIDAPKDAKVYIGSYSDAVVTGANAGDVNITAYNKNLTITGKDVHADNFNVGPETNYLKLDFEGRDFTTNYTNIRDEQVVTIRPDEVITYELTDGANGYNQPTLKPGEKTTYLIGPGKDDPTPKPDDPTPDPNDPAKLLKTWVPDDPTAAPVNTPVAFAADLDDDEEEAGVRKNVDGSVTVVRAFPMMGS